MPTRPLLRRPWSAAADRLESRLTPALPIVGPWSPTQRAEAETLAAVNWTALAELPTAPPALTPFTDIAAFLPLTLDAADFTQRLNSVPHESALNDIRESSFQLALPGPDGAFHRFRVVEVQTMEPGLVAQFPGLKTYRGQGVDDPAASLAMDVTVNGFHASVLAEGGSWYVDPYYHLDQSVYAAYYRSDLDGDQTFVCLTGSDGTGCGCAACQAAAKGEPGGSGGGGGSGGPGGPVILTSNGTTLRTYRAAIAGTGEYTAFHGGTVDKGQAAIVTALNRINQVYERDLAVRMVLVANNSSLVYTNSGTDPYTNTDAIAMLDQNQATLDSVIGSANYDIGHVFATGTGGGVLGVAGSIGNVGVPGQKGKGVSTALAPINDPFVINLVAHEMGHQFGGRHTFSSCGGGTGDNAIYAFEPGGGSSIMGYAGICNGNENLQNNSDAMFHSGSLDLMVSYITTSANGQGNTKTATGNSLPTVNAGLDYTIPTNTPFVLTASGSDADGDALTYSWEQRDSGGGNDANPESTAAGPLFRGFTPTASPSRFFPRLNNVLNNTTSLGETLPTVARAMNFRAVVRDNRANGGGINDDNMKVTVVNTGAAFAVTAPNTAVTWSGGSLQNITWNVAGTTASGINAANVNIQLSTDGGSNWTVIEANTPNDGSQFVTIPDTPTTAARIKVQPTNNIFYDVSNANFTIKAGSAMKVTGSAPLIGTVVAAPLTALDVTFSLPVDAASVGTTDLALSIGTVTQAEVIAAQTVRYTLSGVTGEGAFTATLFTNAVQSSTGIAVDSAIFSYTLDVGTGAFPLPLSAVAPAGSLVYTGTASGVINAAGDTDAYTIDLEAGQTAVVRVTPSAGLQVTVTLTGPGGVNQSVTASFAGQAVAVPLTAVSTAGVYTITLGGAASTVGDYAAVLELNAAPEVEINDEPASAQSLAAAAYDLGGGATRAAIRGKTDAPGGLLAFESESNNTTGTANDASNNFLAYTGNLYHLGLSGNVTTNDVDVYEIGALQAGDVISITLSGAPSSRGTLSDPLVALARSNGTVIAQSDDEGPGADSLIHRFTVTVNDTYYIAAQGFNSKATGTYQLGVQLENTGTAPATGGAVVSETESNNTIGTANKAGTSWRAVQYQSTTKGSISATTDVDYTRYTFTSGDLVTITAAPTSGTLDARINLRNAAGTIIASENGSSVGPGTASSITAYRVTSTGTYFVDVASNGGTGGYALTLSLSAATPPPQGAVPFDYFALPLTAGQVADAALVWGNGNLDVAITDAAGTVLAGGISSPGYNEIVNFTASKTETVYVRVGGAPQTDYTLTVTSGALLEREDNNSFAGGQVLTAGRVLGVHDGGANDDWFRFDAAAGQAIELATTTHGGAAGEFTNNLDPVLELYGATGNLLTSDDNSAGDGRNAKLTWTAAETGTYAARLKAATGTFGEYTLSQKLGVINDPPATVAAVQVNDGSPQRSRVTSVSVTFSEAVTLPANAAEAFVLSRTGPNTPTGDVALTAKAAGNTVTLTFGGTLTEGLSLIDGNYTLTILAAKVSDGGGQLLDGDNDGQAGGDATAALFRLFGDADGNRSVNFADFLAFRANFGLTGVPGNMFDSDDNAAINFADFLAFRTRFGAALAP